MRPGDCQTPLNHRGRQATSGHRGGHLEIRTRTPNPGVPEREPLEPNALSGWFEIWMFYAMLGGHEAYRCG